MGHNGHGINLHGVVMILMGNLHACGQSNLGYSSLLHRELIFARVGSSVNISYYLHGSEFFCYCSKKK